MRDSSLGLTNKDCSLSLAERLSNYQATRRELEALQREDDQFKHLWTSTSIVKLRRRPEVLKNPKTVPSDGGAQTLCSTTHVRKMKTFFRTLATEPKLREEKDVRSLAEWTRAVDIFYGLTMAQVRTVCSTCSLEVLEREPLLTGRVGLARSAWKSVALQKGELAHHREL